MELWGCGNGRAGKKYQITVAVEMLAYMVITWGVTDHVRKYPASGVELFVLAALPSVPILGVLLAVGVYLREEQDEFQRNIMVRCLLWGTAAVLAVSAFVSFLVSFGWKGSAPPFLDFVLFWIVMGIAKLSYRIANRVKTNE
jgi:hypothetical protein